MPEEGEIEEQASHRSYGKPYTAKHPIPTIQGYREHRAELDQRQKQTGGVISEDYESEAERAKSESKPKRAYESVKAIAKNEDEDASHRDPYPTANRNFADRPTRKHESNTAARETHEDQGDSGQDEDGNEKKKGGGDLHNEQKSATEQAMGRIDPKQKRKDMKNIKRHGAGREVTDPITHLPVVIHDMMDSDLGAAPENESAAGSTHHTRTGPAGALKSDEELEAEKDDMQKGLRGMMKAFPPPDFQCTKKEMIRVYKTALVAGLGSISAVATLAVLVVSLMNDGASGKPWSSLLVSTSVPLATGIVSIGLAIGIAAWLERRLNDVFDDETWDSAKREEGTINDSDVELPESVAWLNSLLSSIWPLINPELFASVSDMLEDVMQASLPKIIRMVSVDDLGQGSEAVRILGVRWLPTGAASQSVDEHGDLEPAKENDRTSPGEGQVESGESGDNGHSTNDAGDAKDPKPQANKQREEEQQAVREGMEAEEGDFVNMELAFAYRAKKSGKSVKSKATNAHIYLKFYLPGGIAVPVWVELRGIIGIMRLRLQLAPDPPFFSLCTLSFLGQPRASLSCIPLSKHSLNVMDVPFISSFVQSAIDAALAEYVAPKSLTLDLKAMLVGDDFKKDTSARGVVVLNIKKASGFKNGDGGIGPIQGSSDAYVTASWGKYGKPVASTRIILDEMEPCWNEWTAILVTPEEVNARETLRLQVWDSDKHTADDDLGRTEVDLKELMHSSRTKNKFSDREDKLRGEDPDEEMPGTLTWTVGYFAKAHLQKCQLEKQSIDRNIHSVEELETNVTKDAAAKLREASGTKDESKEKHQQTVQGFKEKEDEMIISAPAPDELASGILSIQIHNITGLGVQTMNNEDRKDGDQEHEAEQSDDMPDGYCTIIMNHSKVYRTRTKPKNANPFFNAGTERFVLDWQTTEIIVSVRDSREAENDPLLGVVYLPLRRVFEKRSQVIDTYPIAGGIGYGRARISMVWRSVDLKMPRELMGWDYGTLEVKVPIKINGRLQDESLKDNRIKLKTRIGKVKLQSGDDGWQPKRKNDDNSVFLGVIRRYASPLLVEFRRSHIGDDSTPAFAVLWLHQIPDEEDKTVTLKVWKGGKANLKRARDSCEYQGLEEGEQPLGEIELTLRFWRGLGGYHKRYASKSTNHDMRDVMEVLDTVNDEKMADDEDDNEEDSDYDDDGSSTDSEYDKISSKGSQGEENKRKMLRKAGNDSSSHLSSSGDEGGPNPISKVTRKTNSFLRGPPQGDDAGNRGLRSQVQDYRQHRKQLHRKHHGIMQWKAARTLDWMSDKASASKSKLQEVFEHTEKDRGIETEV